MKAYTYDTNWENREEFTPNTKMERLPKQSLGYWFRARNNKNTAYILENAQEYQDSIPFFWWKEWPECGLVPVIEQYYPFDMIDWEKGIRIRLDACDNLYCIDIAVKKCVIAYSPMEGASVMDESRLA